MKIAITAHGEDSEAIVDSRFGRADFFVIYDQEHDSWACVSNEQSLTAAHGAGIQAGQHLLESGATVLVTGHVGPKAFRVLNKGNVKMYSFQEMTGTVQDVLQAFQEGKLKLIEAANALEPRR